jgi:hypothetical protein
VRRLAGLAPLLPSLVVFLVFFERLVGLVRLTRS